jgi:hypothetical protein
VTPVTATSPLPPVTVAAQVAAWPPSAALTVMVAAPAVAPGVTAAVRPLLETAATDVLLLLHVTTWLVALDGMSVVVRLPVAPPATKLSVAGLTFTPVTETVSGTGSGGSSLLLHETKERDSARAKADARLWMHFFIAMPLCRKKDKKRPRRNRSRRGRDFRCIGKSFIYNIYVRGEQYLCQHWHSIRPIRPSKHHAPSNAAPDQQRGPRRQAGG